MKPSVLSTISPQYIVDSKGNKTSVVLDVKTYTSMIEELEDLYDIMQAEEILAKGGSLDSLDLLKNFMGREPNPDAYIQWLSE